MSSSSRSTLRVLVVDDTAVFRKVLSEAVKSIDGLELVGTAPNGKIALKKIELTEVDLVLLDIFMPELNGLETLKILRKEHPKTNAIMISGATTRDAAITIEALERGAIEFIPKPQVNNYKDGMGIISQEIARAVQPLLKYEVSTVTQPPFKAAKKAPIETKKPPAVAPSDFSMVVIGVSTGGPRTLAKIIPKLPKNIACPILIVQHMPPTFTASLAEHLNKNSELTVVEASDKQAIENGTVYIAPGGFHLCVKRNGAGYKTSINEDAPVKSCRPSVDVLFQSVADTVSGNILAVMLTGMGDDGADGVEYLKNKRCYCLSQSQESCVVYGMPQAIEKRNLADEVIHCDEVAERITTLVNR